MLELTSPASRQERTASKGVLWRTPADFQERIRSYAKHHALSQNAYITAGMIFWSLVSEPEESRTAQLFRQLCGVMENSAQEGKDVLCTCPAESWTQVRSFLDLLQAADLVEGYQARVDDQIPQLVLYAFGFTKEGREAWKAIGKKLAMAFSG